MANTYTLINSTTVGSGGAANITFSSIPATYTDLKLVFSLRSDTTGVTEFEVELNSTNPTEKELRGNGISASSNTNAFILANASTTTASTFSNGEVYVSNYAGSNAKTTSIDNVTENNATAAYAETAAGYYSSVTGAVTSIRLADNYGSWVQYSTAYLYGIKNS